MILIDTSSSNYTMTFSYHRELVEFTQKLLDIASTKESGVTVPIIYSPDKNDKSYPGSLSIYIY